jgi:hypothetical protein
MSCSFCEGQCSCHINPPCGFCTSHVECDICGQLVCEDKATEVTNKSDGNKITVCPDCEERSNGE